VRLVAVLPVAGKASLHVDNAVLRARFIDALYVRGYPKIPADFIDEVIATSEKEHKVTNATKEVAPRLDDDGAFPYQEWQEALGVDAFLCIDIKESELVGKRFIAFYVLEASLRLIDARTGEELWTSSYRDSDWLMGVNRARLQVDNMVNYGRSLMNMVNFGAGAFPEKRGF